MTTTQTPGDPGPEHGPASVAPPAASSNCEDLPPTDHVPFKAQISASQVESRFLKCMADHPRYELEGEIGIGGMGAVYRAKHRLMGRTVALKVVHPQWVDQPVTVERFRREMQAVAKIQHANIVAAFDADHVDGIHFLVMEYVEGETLAQLLRREGKLPCALACEYMRQAALGLQEAHQRHMVHRDIKPQNLMLTPAGVIKILDFGLARIVVEQEHLEDVVGIAVAGVETALDGSLTHADALLGTADYVAPEQIRDARNADIRADIYSLGCTLYHLLAGEPPYPDPFVCDKIRGHEEREPEPLGDLTHGVPVRLAEVIAKMMAKNAAQRYQTPAEVVLALEPFVADRKAPSKIARWLPALTLLVLMAAAIGGWLGYRGYFADTNGAPPTQLDLGAPVVESKPRLDSAALLERLKKAYAVVSVPGKPATTTCGGVIVSAVGEIIIPLSSIDNATTVEVLLADEGKLEGTVIRTDPKNDLALIKIDANTERRFLSPRERTSARIDESIQMWQQLEPYKVLSRGTVSAINQDMRLSDELTLRGLIQLQLSKEAWDYMQGIVADDQGRLVGFMINPREGPPVFFAVPAPILARLLDGKKE